MATIISGVKGIYPKVNSKGEISYQVRFMKDGVKICLGTFLSHEKALRAMIDWKLQDDLKKLGNAAGKLTDIQTVQVEATEASAQSHPQFEEFISLLESVDPSTLEWHKGALIDGIAIPASIVAHFQNKLFGLS